MQSGNKESLLNSSQKSILILFFALIICSVFVLKSFIFQPTFLEFYADWCEVCKKMAPQVDDIKNKYEKDINFVFLDVDNPKWEKYIRNLSVNGIPQINIFDKDSNLELTFIGKQEEVTIKESLDNLYDKFRGDSQILNSEFSKIKDNKNYQSSPRSHG